MATVKLNLNLHSQDWLNTGVVVQPGQTFSIAATGAGIGGTNPILNPVYPEGCYDGEEITEYNPEANPPDLEPLGPSVYGSFQCHPAPTFCLMAAIKTGSGAPSSSGNSWSEGIYVGRSVLVTPDDNVNGGHLWLCLNNGFGGYADSSGQFQIVIEERSHTYGRHCSQELAAEFDKPAPQTTFLLAIEPLRGPAEGYTSFDQDLHFLAVMDEYGEFQMVPELDYSSEGSVLPTEVASKTGGSDDTIDIVSGLLEGRRIKWENEYYLDGTVTLMAAKWSNPAAGVLILFSGKFGKGTLGDVSAKFELRPWVHLLQRNILRTIAPVCDCPLFAQGRCAGNGEDPEAPQIADRRHVATVTSVANRSSFTIGGIGESDGWADFGRVYFTSGDNESCPPRIVKRYTSATGRVIMHNEMPQDIQVGDELVIEEGCLHTWEACQEKGNTNNFQGFPFLPGQQGVVKRYQA